MFKMRGVVCWAEKEGRGDTTRGHERGSINRGRQRVGREPQGSITTNFNDIIQLKEEVSYVMREIVEMRSEIRSMLAKIYDVKKILAFLCVVMVGVLK